MNEPRTISCTFNTTFAQIVKIDATLSAFKLACEHVHRSIPPNLKNEVAIQALIYHQIREEFHLPAQLAIHVIRRVANTRKLPDQIVFSNSTVYDVRSISLRPTDWTVSLSTVAGRERFPLVITNYQRGLLLQHQLKIKTAVLSSKLDRYWLTIKI
ncbi:hypothetical protein [Chamaesiphon sp.]|uniref:hypothetical protein n=1 Tax=Chamaesiphon sp. TaxID=2814140 RepID=UPI00359370BE